MRSPSLSVLFTVNCSMVDQSQPDMTHSLNRVEEEVRGPAVERQLQLVLTHRGPLGPPWRSRHHEEKRCSRSFSRKNVFKLMRWESGVKLKYVYSINVCWTKCKQCLCFSSKIYLEKLHYFAGQGCHTDTSCMLLSRVRKLEVMSEAHQ